MAIIRTAAFTGAALVALTAIVPAPLQAQGPGAPLELVPGRNQAKSAPRPAINNKNAAKPVNNKNAAKSVAKAPGNATTKAPGKATTKTAARPSPRQNIAAVQPVSKAAPTNSRTLANSRQKQIATNTQRARSASSPPVIRAAVVPYLTATRPVLRRGTREPPVIARGPTTNAPQDHVMRGRDTVSLVGMLPWWRNDRMQAVNYGSVEAESKVLEAAAVWLAAHGGETQGDQPAGDPLARASVDEAIELADASEVNDIDLAAESVPAPQSPSFLQSLLALIGGAAVAAVASARLLFA